VGVAWAMKCSLVAGVCFPHSLPMAGEEAPPDLAG